MEFIVLFPFWLFSNFIQKRKQFLNNLISGEYTFMFPSVTDYVLCLRFVCSPKSRRGNKTSVTSAKRCL